MLPDQPTLYYQVVEALSPLTLALVWRGLGEMISKESCRFKNFGIGQRMIRLNKNEHGTDF